MRNRVVSRTVYTNHVHVVDVVPNENGEIEQNDKGIICLLYTSPSPRDTR